MANKEAAQQAKAAGNAAFQAGNAQEAVKKFTEAIGHDPTDHVLYSNRSGAYALAEQFDKALEDAEKCIEISPTWAKGYSRKGLALFKAGRIQEAVEAYGKGVEIDPANQQLQEGLQQARSGFLSTMLEERLKGRISQLLLEPKFKAYARDDPQYKDKVLKAAVSMFSSMTGPNMAMPQHPEPAVQEGLEAVLGGVTAQQEEEDEERQARAAAAAAEKKREEEKKKASADKMAQQTPEEKEAEELKQQANALYKQKKFDDAHELYDKAAALNPRDLLILNNKAAVYLEQGEYEKCIKLCEEAIDKRYDVKADFGTIGKILNRMANCYMKMKDYDNAIEMFHRSLVEDNNRHTRTALKEAERLKEKNIRDAYLDPVKAEEHRQKGNELYKDKDYVNAKKEYDEAIRRSPEDAKLYSNRAAALMNLLEYPSALSDVEKALELDPQYVKGWSRKGTIHSMMKAYPKAQEAYRRGLLIDPDNVECKNGLEQTMNAVMENQRSGAVDEEQVKQAMDDPEIRNILSDPQFRLILDQISQNPENLKDALKDKKIADGLQKLMAAGIVRVGP